jgi:hypothetical protein
MEVVEKFTVLHTAVRFMELGFSRGAPTAFEEALKLMRTTADELEKIYREALSSNDNQATDSSALQENEMSKKGNHTTKPIKGGTKTPKNNQGTKPSPKGGNTKGGK